MIKKFIFPISILFLVVILSMTNAYEWPIVPSREHPILGTLGEFRGRHFHGGIDIGAPSKKGRFDINWPGGEVVNKSVDKIKKWFSSLMP